VERAAEGVQLLVAEKESDLCGHQSGLAQEPTGCTMTDVVEQGLVAGPEPGEPTLETPCAGSELLRDVADARPLAIESAAEERPDVVGDRG